MYLYRVANTDNLGEKQDDDKYFSTQYDVFTEMKRDLLNRGVPEGMAYRYIVPADIALTEGLDLIRTPDTKCLAVTFEVEMTGKAHMVIWISDKLFLEEGADHDAIYEKYTTWKRQ